jgi:superoxide dismutase
MDQHLGIGTRIKHHEYGQGIVCKITLSNYMISFFEGGLREVERTEDLEVVENIEPENNTISFDDVETLMVNLLDKYAGLQETVELGDRWKDGLLVLEPADENLQVKEIPIETFFHKIVMVRDRLRVLEQNINSSKKLDDEDKVNLQQYITRIYGSLTTFNVLFKNKEDQFKGEGRKS